jgi:hypothetical protein
MQLYTCSSAAVLGAARWPWMRAHRVRQLAQAILLGRQVVPPTPFHGGKRLSPCMHMPLVVGLRNDLFVTFDFGCFEPDDENFLVCLPKFCFEPCLFCRSCLYVGINRFSLNFLSPGNGQVKLTGSGNCQFEYVRTYCLIKSNRIFV